MIKKGQIIDQDIIALDPDEQAEPISEYFCKKTNTVVLSSRPSIFNRVVPNQNAPFEILDSGNLELFISTNNNNNNKVKLFKTYNETEGGCNYKPMIDLGSEVLRINNLVSTIACSKSSNKSLNSFTGNSYLSSPLSFPLVPSA